MFDNNDTRLVYKQLTHNYKLHRQLVHCKDSYDVEALYNEIKHPEECIKLINFKQIFDLMVRR